MGRAFSASTSAIDPAERIAFWNAGSSRIGGVRAESISDVFDAEVAHRRLDNMSVFRLCSTPHRVTMNPLAPTRDAMLRLRYQQTGETLIFQGNKSVQLLPGDWMIIDPQQQQSAINHGDVSHLWLEVPCSSLQLTDLEAVHAMISPLPLNRTTGGNLRESMLHAITAPGDMSQDEARDLARQLTSMFRKALDGLTGGRVPQSPRSDLALRAREYIDRNLHDPDLSLDQIARALGCTRRYVHKTFDGSETVSRYIWNRRLDLCRSRLEKQGEQSTTLTALAFDYGFNSSSHFSRSFRERFGTSPSSYLAQVQQAKG
ncbi:helix-turn-helix domain-containing protein [Aurantiacibacter gilvus]|uniref:Helix-turn-helix domain-containing protein n=1 Tax=Aurantiacibacter gilvus TaxID=3139141 RepID=A0ABU9IF00_9SPHN